VNWQVSKYTHALAVQDRGVLYNGRTGAVAELSAEGFACASGILNDLRNGKQPHFSGSDAELFEQLKIGGFVVDAGLDELALIEAQYQRERKYSQFLLTILPTFGCNLGCDYCFVGKKHGLMGMDIQEKIVRFVESKVVSDHPPSMHVDWFGGEPLLGLKIIERLSERFLDICGLYGLPYQAQVITNGTMITNATVNTLLRAGVDRLQITIDGPAEMHDVRRPYKKGSGSSFDAIMESLPRVIGRFVVRLRINVDDRNIGEVWPLLDIFDRAGWLGPETNFFPHLARISAFTDACSSASPYVTPLDDFYSAQFKWMEELDARGVPLLEQGRYQFPEPKLYNCGAVGKNGFVFTPEGEIHKCGLEVDNSATAVGHLHRGIDENSPHYTRFADYSPFANKVCRDCEFLPTCLGGCPRDRIDNRELQVKENCTYHKKFEEQILLFHLGHREGIKRAIPMPRSAENPSSKLFNILS